METLRSILTFLVALNLPATASVTIDWVTVGNPGNAADTADGDQLATGVQRYGAVGYSYKISKYEGTNAQYGAFLNAVAKTDNYELYNDNMSSFGITRSGNSGSYTYLVTSELTNRPVVYVSWLDAARFANWLVNGQGSGSTETGSYTLDGATYGIYLANAGAQIYIPTEDEWYKAAYYNAANSTYSLYPNGQNTLTTADANYGSSVGSGSSTNVGTYSGDPSYYGTSDQGGNVWEWNDAAVSDANRGLRGGAWAISSPSSHLAGLRSSYRGSQANNYEFNNVGFRLVAVPEPSSLALTMLFSGAILIRRRR